MTCIRAFRGLRYNLDKVSLDDVVAPPYDVIDPDQQSDLRARSPYNIIHVSLPEAGDSCDRYAHAADLLADWQDTDVLREDAQPSLYLLSESFEIDGRSFTRIGLTAAVRLEPFGAGSIFPHEGTLSAPKADRLNLMKAAAVNVSPVLAMFSDADGTVRALFEDALAREPLAHATVPTGTCRLRRISAPEVISRIVESFETRGLFIADGHHRYETALAYRDSAGVSVGPDGPADYMMMHLVVIEDEALKALPTHRLVRPGAAPELAELLDALAGDFEVTELKLPDAGVPELPGPEARFGTFLMYADGRTWQLSLSEEVKPADINPDAGEDWCRLDVTVLQKRVFEPILNITRQKLERGGLVGYSHDAAESVELVNSGEYALAFLLRPTPVRAVAAVARNLEKMPPKSTYFYPKVSAGFVLRTLSSGDYR